MYLYLVDTKVKLPKDNSVLVKYLVCIILRFYIDPKLIISEVDLIKFEIS